MHRLSVHRRGYTLPTSGLVITCAVGLLVSACSTPAAPAQKITDSPAVATPVPSASSTAESDDTELQRDGGNQGASTPPGYRPPPINKNATTVVSRIRTKKKIVFITIDDGGYRPSPAAAAQVLKRNRIPATQFLVTSDVAWSRDFYGGVSQRDGQTIQNHMVDHESLTSKSLAGQQQQICGANEDLQLWYGDEPWMIRPPFGEMNDNTRSAAARCGIDYIVMWTVDAQQGSFKYNFGDELRPGDIILFHWGPSLDWDLEWAVQEIERQGFTVAVLQDYLPRSD